MTAPSFTFESCGGDLTLKSKDFPSVVVSSQDPDVATQLRNSRFIPSLYDEQQQYDTIRAGFRLLDKLLDACEPTLREPGKEWQVKADSQGGLCVDLVNQGSADLKTIALKVPIDGDAFLRSMWQIIGGYVWDFVYVWENKVAIQVDAERLYDNYMSLPFSFKTVPVPEKAA